MWCQTLTLPGRQRGKTAFCFIKQPCCKHRLLKDPGLALRRGLRRGQSGDQPPALQAEPKPPGLGGTAAESATAE